MAKMRDIADKSGASQGAEEMYWLLINTALIKPKVILEIGVHLGHSLKAWNDAFKPKTLVGLDNETNDTLNSYMENGELGNCKIVYGDSHDDKTGEKVVEALESQFVDFLFLDGDHTYDGVRKDFEMYAPLVRKGGIVAFHDACIKNHPLVQVYKLLDELETVGRKITRYHNDANGVGILHV